MITTKTAVQCQVSLGEHDGRNDHHYYIRLVPVLRV